MNVSELIEKLNKEINEYLESGSREDNVFGVTELYADHFPNMRIEQEG